MDHATRKPDAAFVEAREDAAKGRHRTYKGSWTRRRGFILHCLSRLKFGLGLTPRPWTKRFEDSLLDVTFVSPPQTSYAPEGEFTKSFETAHNELQIDTLRAVTKQSTDR